MRPKHNHIVVDHHQIHIVDHHQIHIDDNPFEILPIIVSSICDQPMMTDNVCSTMGCSIVIEMLVITTAISIDRSTSSMMILILLMINRPISMTISS
jgi:hypothetical protein